MVRNGKLTTIIFIRDKNAKGQEVSGYIDFAHRLKARAMFMSITPHPSHLSSAFYSSRSLIVHLHCSLTAHLHCSPSLTTHAPAGAFAPARPD